MLTGEQVREARRLLGWGRIRFSRTTAIPQPLLEAVKSTDGVAWLTAEQERTFRSAFEAAGIEFVSEGVRLRRVQP